MSYGCTKQGSGSWRHLNLKWTVSKVFFPLEDYLEAIINSDLHNFLKLLLLFIILFERQTDEKTSSIASLLPKCQQHAWLGLALAPGPPNVRDRAMRACLVAPVPPSSRDCQQALGCGLWVGIPSIKSNTTKGPPLQDTSTLEVKKK